MHNRKVTQSSAPPLGYWLKVDDMGAWELSARRKVTDAQNKKAASQAGIASGKVPFGPDARHRLALRFSGTQITPVIDGQPLTTVKDTAAPAGMVGLGSGWQGAQFDNLRITSVNKFGE